MKNKEKIINELSSMIKDAEKIRKYLIVHSNLPGPRSNLELAFAFAEVFQDKQVCFEWINSKDKPDVNDPESFPAFCAAVCLGRIYGADKDSEIISTLKTLANDERWRMKEAVAFGFQLIGEQNFDELKEIFSGWINKAGNAEKRAILVSLAHPPFLNRERAEYALEISDYVLKNLNEEKGSEQLIKGLNFCLSVYTAAYPEKGFDFMTKWLNKTKIINRILKENLKKNRLLKKDTQRVEEILSQM